MEVVEAAAAQLETLKFNGTGLGVGQGQTVQSPSSVPVPAPPPLPQSDEGSADTEKAVEAQLAREQLPELVLSTGVGGNPAPQLRPEPPSGGSCVTGASAAALARTPDSLETSDSDSDSDRSGACGSRSCGERACVTCVGSPGLGPEWMLARAGDWGRRSLTLTAHVLTSNSNRPFLAVHCRCGCES